MRSAYLATLVLLTLPLDAQTKGNLSPDVIFAQSKESVVTILTFNAQKAPLGQGSGFIIAKDRVVTNYHVLAESTSASIIFNDGSMTIAKAVVAASLPKDIVIMAAETGNRPPLPLGDELKLKVGEPVYAIGAPNGLSASLSSGLVSAFRQDEGQFLIQITAAVAPGSSGGPLFNSQGQVVGVTTSRLKDGGFGFAVGAGDVQHLLKVPLPITIQLSDLSPDETATPDDELKPVQALFDQKKYPEALTSLQKTSAQVQASFDGQLLFCRIRVKIADYNPAILACDAAIQLQPDSAEAYGEKAFSLLASGEDGLAETPAAKAAELSNDAYYANLLALVYYSEEKFALVPKQLSADSKDTFQLTMLAGAALHNGDKDSFQQLCAKITAIKGADNGWQFYRDGIAALRDLDFVTAEEKFRKCDADDNFIDPACITLMADAETRKLDYGSAKSTIDSAVARYPRNHSVLSLAIFIDLLTGNIAEAIRLHDKLQTLTRETRDEFTDCLYYYGVNRAAAATGHCAAAIKGSEGEYTAWSNAGYVALDNGQFQSAATYFAKAYDIFYSSKDKHTGTEELDLNWGITLAGYYSGDKKDARRLYRAIKKDYPQFVTMTNLKELPLIWSENTQALINKVIADFK
jgi:tetratricopeptide (TPR) repeat protein